MRARARVRAARLVGIAGMMRGCIAQSQCYHTFFAVDSAPPVDGAAEGGVRSDRKPLGIKV